MKTVAEATASELMTTDVLTVRDDLPVRELAELLVAHEISGTVVLDAGRKPVGVVSVVDIARAAAQGENVVGTADIETDFYAGEGDIWDEDDLDDLPLGDRTLLVRDIMTPAIYAIGEDTPLREIARQMVDNHLHRLLVLRNEQVAGIVSSTDLLRQVAGPPEPS